jgi:hypothetical protein
MFVGQSGTAQCREKSLTATIRVDRPREVPTVVPA